VITEACPSAPAPKYWNKGGHGQFSGGTWRARGTRAYNRGLGQSPQRGPGQSPWSGSQGANPPEAESFLALGRVTDRANL